MSVASLCHRRFRSVTRGLMAALAVAGCADDRLTGPPPETPTRPSLLATGVGDGIFAYVANFGSDNVSVIRLSDNTVTATVPVGHWPFGVAMTPNGEHVFVASIATSTVSVIQTSDNTVAATVAVGSGPHGVAVRPDGAFAYVADHGARTVSVIRVADNTVTATVPVGDAPYGLAFTPDGASLYVANTNSNDVSVIRTSDNTVTATLPVESRPRGVAVTPDGAYLYVLNQVSDNISVIRTSDNALTATVPAGDGPFGIAITPDGAEAYVANIFSNTVTVIRTADNTVTATLPVGAAPVGIAVTPDGAYLYVANQDDDNVSVIRTSDHAVAQLVPVGDGPRVMALGQLPLPQTIGFTSAPPTPAAVGGSYTVAATGGGSGNPVRFTAANACTLRGSIVRLVAVGPCTIRANQAGGPGYRAAPEAEQTFFVAAGRAAVAYVANLGSDNVSVIRLSDNTVTATVPVGHWPFGVALGPDGAYAYVANILTNTLSVIRTSDNSVAATVPVGGGPHDVAVRPDGAFAYVANHNGTSVSVLRTSDHTVTATVPVGNNPYGLAFTPDGASLYVTNTNSANVSVVRTSDNTVTGTIATGASPRGAVASPDGAFVYVANQVADNVSVIRVSDNAVVATVPVGDGPFGLDVTPDGSRVYVGNIFDASVSVIRTSDNTVTATLQVGPSPVGVAVTPDGAHVYVAVQDADNISVIRTADNAVAATIAVGSGPRILAIGFVPTPQEIAFTSAPPSPARVGTSYTVAASGGGSGNPVAFTASGPACSIAGSVVSLVAVGTCTITANQDGNASHAAAPPAEQSFAVEKGEQTITIATSPPDPAFVGSTYSLAATGGGSGNAVVLTTADPATCGVSGSLVTFAGQGTCQVYADQAASANYDAAPRVSQTIAVVKRAQGIAFTSTPPNPAVIGGTYTAAATGGGSGMPVTFSSLTPVVCSVGGNAVSFLALGVCTLAANQAGNTAYLAAGQQSQQITVRYPFTGFFEPVDGAGTLNVLKASKAVPFRFSLGANRGLNVLQGQPTSVPVACGSGPRDAIEETSPTPQAGIRYEAATNQYVYVWPTDKAWAATCRRFTLTLSDGTTQSALFELTK